MTHYAKRDLEALDVPVPFFSRHMAAMTDEHLYGKGEVAAELAFRDKQLAAANAKVERLRSAAKAVLQTWEQYGDAPADAAEAKEFEHLRKVLSET